MSKKQDKTSAELQAELDKKQKEEKELQDLIKVKKLEEENKELKAKVEGLEGSAKNYEAMSKIVSDCNKSLGLNDGIKVMKELCEYTKAFQLNDGKTVLDYFKQDKQKQ